MKRNEFIKNVAFMFAAAILPKLKKENSVNTEEVLKSGYTVRSRKDGEHCRAMTDQEIARAKMQHLLIQKRPPGRYIEFRKIREISFLNYNYGMD